MKTINTPCPRLKTIDVMRCASMVWIVGYWHLFDYTQAFPSFQNKITGTVTIFALGLFMLISGFLLGCKKISCLRDIKNFYISRFIRIYPPFIIATFLFYYFGFSEGPALVKSLFGLSMLLPPAPITLWFVATLIVFYALAPILIILAQKNASTRFLLVSLIIASVFYSISDYIDVRIVIYFPIFTVGVYLAKKNDLGAKASLVCILSCLISSQILPLLSNWCPFTLVVGQSLFILAGSLSIFKLCVNVNPYSIPLLSMWEKISIASYFMYLFHRPIYHIFKKLYFPQSNTLQVIYLIGVCFSFIIVISYFIQIKYDFFLIKIKQRLTGKFS